MHTCQSNFIHRRIRINFNLAYHHSLLVRTAQADFRMIFKMFVNLWRMYEVNAYAHRQFVIIHVSQFICVDV